MLTEPRICTAAEVLLLRFSKRFIRTFACVCSVAVLSQPATISAQDAGTNVQTIVTQRTGFSVMPSGDAQSDEIISHTITCLLAGTLTKDEAVQVALLNNRNLQATLAEIGIACGDLIEAGMLKNPIFDALYRRSSESNTVPNLEFSVTLDFINILTLPLRRQIAASEFEATKLEVTNEVLNLAFDVQSGYYKFQSAVQMGEMYQLAVEAAKDSYDVAKVVHKAGNITDLELHQEQAIYEEQKLNLAEAERDAVELREELNMLMGLWGPCTLWNLPSELPSMPGREFQGSGLESVAVYQRLDLAAARQEIETLAREFGLENATSLLPELEVGYNAERETDGSWLRGPQASFPIPLFNQGQGRLQKNRAKLLQAQHHYYALAVEIRGQVRKAFSQMRKSRERVRYYDKIMLPLRRRIVEESHLLFNSMDVSPFELLEMKRDEIEAERDRVEALRDYWIARSDLERAMGGSFRCYACADTAVQGNHQQMPGAAMGPARAQATGMTGGAGADGNGANAAATTSADHAGHGQSTGQEGSASTGANAGSSGAAGASASGSSAGGAS